MKKLNVTFEKIEGGFVLESDSVPLGTIYIGWLQLQTYKGDGRKPSQELLDDIAVYEHILKSANPERLAEEYLAARDYDKTKMENARALGWIVK